MIHLHANNQPLDTATVVEWQDIEFSCTPPVNATLELTIEHAEKRTTLEPFLRPGTSSWYWRWNPQNVVGHVTLTMRTGWSDGRVDEHHTTLVVSPYKIDRDQYQAILDDLQTSVRNILYKLEGSCTGTRLVKPDTYLDKQAEQPVEIEHHDINLYYRMFRDRFAQFEQAVNQIARQPHTNAIPSRKQVATEQAYDLSTIGQDMRHILPTNMDEYEGLPPRITHPYTSWSTDTYENQLLKRVLNELWLHAHRLALLATPPTGTERIGGKDQARNEIALRSATIARRVQTMRSLPFLTHVGPLTRFRGATHTIRRSPAYRQIYRFWQDLRREPLLSVDSTLFHTPIHHLPQLYEYWCLVQVLQILLNLADIETVDQHMLRQSQIQSHLFTWELVENTPLLVVKWRGITLQVRYQPRYQPVSASGEPSSIGSLDSHTHIPDIVLEIIRPVQPPVVLTFDAKYRVTSRGGIPEDVLADAYTYLGSIGLPDGTRATRASVILYPSQGMAEHYTSGVSIIPLLPNNGEELANWLVHIIQSV